jgi:membrane-associated phospholipid phosphatase
VTTTRFWAVDKLILGYFACAAVLLVGWWDGVPGAAVWLAWHIVGAAVLVYEVKRPNRTSWAFRHWYPLPYVASCYREMGFLVPAVRHSDADGWLAALDFRIWGANPTVWLERFQRPPVVEFLQWAYTLFIPAVLLVAYLLWRKGLHSEFRYYAFLIALGFLASYAGYLMVPARGPRFLLRSLQHMPLQGLWLFNGMQATLDRLELANFDCFPSGHTELTILAWWCSRMVSKRVFLAYSAYTPFLIFATVYLRYHYTVDVLAGAVLAFVLIAASPALFRKLS